MTKYKTHTKQHLSFWYSLMCINLSLTITNYKYKNKYTSFEGMLFKSTAAHTQEPAQSLRRYWTHPWPQVVWVHLRSNLKPDSMQSTKFVKSSIIPKTSYNCKMVQWHQKRETYHLAVSWNYSSSSSKYFLLIHTTCSIWFTVWGCGEKAWQTHIFKKFKTLKQKLFWSEIFYHKLGAILDNPSHPLYDVLKKA